MKITAVWADEKFDFIMSTSREVHGYWVLKPWILLAKNYCGKKYFILKVVCIYSVCFLVFCFYRQLFG